ncbi:MAG TPA: OsmC family protein [Devosia sp.]|jgi:organic hydroperoxide reductase OsmC/OhrA|nr:OsmC family protein [Devosia sp.]
MSVSLRNVPGTEAAMGWAGGHTVIVDRPEGRAGGMGLGFNGGQMIALAIGGCFCNDLRYMAETMHVELDDIAVDVEIELDGTPLLVKSATLSVNVTSRDAGTDLAELVRRAAADSTVGNSVQRGFPVAVVSR